MSTTDAPESERRAGSRNRVGILIGAVLVAAIAICVGPPISRAWKSYVMASRLSSPEFSNQFAEMSHTIIMQSNGLVEDISRRPDRNTLYLYFAKNPPKGCDLRVSVRKVLRQTRREYEKLCSSQGIDASDTIISLQMTCVISTVKTHGARPSSQGFGWSDPEHTEFVWPTANEVVQWPTEH